MGTLMNMTHLISGLLLLALLPAGSGTPQAKPVTAVTAAPQLVETGGAGVTMAMTEEGYQKLATQLAKMPAFVLMTKKPAGLGPQARFGIGLTYGGRNRSWALDGDDKAGYVLYADLNANGDLGDDVPLRFELKDGKYSCRVSTNAKASPESGLETYPVTFKLVIDSVPPPGQTEPQLALLRYNAMTRQGSLMLGSAPMTFRIAGSGGTYDEGYNSVTFDLNRDGTLDSKAERYLVSEKYVNVGDTTYEFAVDRYGRSVTLTPLPDKRPARVVLLPGYPAADFSFTHLDGKPGKLSDYRGQVVLVDFWGTWCGPCVAATPELVAAYDKYHARGFEILGVDADEPRDVLEAFVRDKKLPWPQAVDGTKGPIVTLYRVTGFPSYFLIGKDGTVVVAAPGGAKFDLEAELGKLLGVGTLSARDAAVKDANPNSPAPRHRRVPRP